ncbi:uncharacterized protein LOC132453776 [Gadus macrocephalus]|uniref:uncharacterized protein LOC132453776 n=1 Tax=Gadus macrocephalus TaxID=80720 RepID=UPI0028CB2CD4|nr:uncharacterized protein LOC132453776 [Gadus macrocephalus]
MEEISASVVMTEHDFGSAPKPGALDAAAVNIQQLEETVKELMRAVTAESGSSAFSQILCLRRGHPFLHQIHVEMFFVTSGRLFNHLPPCWFIGRKLRKRNKHLNPFLPVQRVDCNWLSFFSSAAGLLQACKRRCWLTCFSAVTFVSSLFTGSISDPELTERSGLLDLLEPGDGCMADKGFTIEKPLADRGATLIIPPFKMTVH